MFYAVRVFRESKADELCLFVSSETGIFDAVKKAKKTYESIRNIENIPLNIRSIEYVDKGDKVEWKALVGLKGTISEDRFFSVKAKDFPNAKLAAEFEFYRKTNFDDFSKIEIKAIECLNKNGGKE